MRLELTTPATKPCNKCGSTSIAWQTAKSGRWYLTEVFTDLDERDVTDRRDFHSAYCGEPDAHTKRQAEITKVLREERDDEDSDRAERQAKREADALANFIALNDLAESDPEAGRKALAERERELENFNLYPPTMDYMVEFGKAVARAEVLRNEIEILTAALDAIGELDD